MNYKKSAPRRVERHLFQGENGYFARMGIPVGLRTIVGQREFWKPVAAETDAKARRKLAAIVAGFHATLDAARAQAKAQRAAPRGKPLPPQQLAVAQYDARLQVDDELRNTDGRYAQHGFVDSDHVDALKRIISGAADNGQIRDTLGAVLRFYEVRGHVKAASGSPQWREAARALAVAELEALAREVERDEGDFTGKPSNPLLIAKPQPIAAKADPLAVRRLCDDSDKTLAEIALDFIRERHASGQTEYDAKRTARLFEECVEAKPIYQITRQDVHAFKRTLAELPASATKRFPGMTAPEAIKANKGRATPYDVLLPRTINEGYLSRLHSIFAWCVRNDIIPDNPAAGIKIDMVKAKEPPRIPFAPSDLTKVFAPTRFKKIGEQGWAELLALFTGARASELGQLKLDSVRHQREILVLVIEEATKNLGSQRVIPVHSTLLALGFQKYVDQLRAKGETHLFPVWHAKSSAALERAKANGKMTLNLHYPRFVPRAFNVTILPGLGINDPRKCWHSFRHTFKSGLKDSGVEKGMRDDLAGHADHSAGAGYEHGDSIEAKKAAIEKLRFDGFTLLRSQLL